MKIYTNKLFKPFLRKNQAFSGGVCREVALPRVFFGLIRRRSGRPGNFSRQLRPVGESNRR